MNETYAEVIVPLPLNALFTYRVPRDMVESVGVGHRVIVPFGPRRFCTGIVTSLSPKAPKDIEIKDVAMSLDAKPIVRHPQLKLWEWMADYYLCAPGDVYRVALPAGLKIESETFVENNPDYEMAPDEQLSEREAIITQLLDHEGTLTVAAIASKTGFKGVERVVNDMIERGLIIISEKLVERYRAKQETYVRPLFTADALQEAFARVKGARRQETLLLALIEMARVKTGGEKCRDVLRSDLLERSQCSPALLNELVKKGLVETFKKVINPFAYNGAPPIALPRLSEPQTDALDAIHRSWLEKPVTLLHGVTSSGKTEIYQHLIADVLARGRQVLYLVPEIALTTQLSARLQAVFGSRVVVYHSKFSDNDRVDIWKRLLDDPSPCVVLGARSSLFLPFSSLGLVIVDEEHEQSFKQYDPAPRYNARDCAIVLASMHGAKTLLGSATPSIETYYKAETGKFGLVSLMTRYSNAPLPSIEVVDMQQARKSKRYSGTFADATAQMVRNQLADGNQIILFQPRRGFSPLARCRQCAWTPKCDRCDVSLTYHRDINQLVCHYCGSAKQLPRVCPQCKEPAIETLGYGTERVEDEVAGLFPDRRITRMDLDTTRNKASYEKIIEDFSQRRSDILVGTQMVTKGLDFEGVSMVGVLNADTLINFPDFRASERAFNTLEQVAGRAGRRSDTPGHVVIQTADPSNPLFDHLRAHDYLAFYRAELPERQKFFYPPFSRIIYVYLKHRDKMTINRVAQSYTERLRQVFGTRVYGPEKPLVERVNALYIRKVMLKVETDVSMKQVKKLLREIYDGIFQDPSLKGLTIHYDVDPV